MVATLLCFFVNSEQLRNYLSVNIVLKQWRRWDIQLEAWADRTEMLALDSREHVQMDIDRLDFPSKKADKAEL